MRSASLVVAPPVVRPNGFILGMVLIVMVVAVITSAVLLRSVAGATRNAAMGQRALQARLLAESGLTRAAWFWQGGDGKGMEWQTELYREELGTFGTIELSTARFGGYVVAQSSGTRLGLKQTRRGLAGRTLPDLLKPLITLTGKVGGLVLDRGSTVGGTVVLDHGAIRIGKQRRLDRHLQQSTLVRESPELPFDKKLVEEWFDTLALTLDNAKSDSSSRHAQLQVTTRNDSSVNGKTVAVTGDCNVQSGRISHARIVVKGEFRLEGSASITNCFIVAERVSIVSGAVTDCFVGAARTIALTGGGIAAQFWAGDTLSIGSGVECIGENLWVCRRTTRSDSTVTGGISFAPGGKYRGHAVCFSDTLALRDIRAGASLRLGGSVSYTGTLITDAAIDIRDCIIAGHIWARSVETVDKIGYTNWLLGCQLVPAPGPLFFPLWGDGPLSVIMRNERGL